jgi:hypothetical protein
MKPSLLTDLAKSIFYMVFFDSCAATRPCSQRYPDTSLRRPKRIPRKQKAAGCVQPPYLYVAPEGATLTDAEARNYFFFVFFFAFFAFFATV